MRIITQQSKQTSVWAIVALICAFFAPILGIILGIVALVKLKNNPNQKGKGLAIAGIIIGIVFTLIIAFNSWVKIFGVPSPVEDYVVRSSYPEKCIMDPGINCINSKVESSQITLVLSNGLGKTMTVKSIDVKGCSSIFDTTITSGSDATFVIGGKCNNGNIEDFFKGDIILTVEEDNQIKTRYGVIQKVIE